MRVLALALTLFASSGSPSTDIFVHPSDLGDGGELTWSVLGPDEPSTIELLPGVEVDVPEVQIVYCLEAEGVSDGARVTVATDLGTMPGTEIWDGIGCGSLGLTAPDGSGGASSQIVLFEDGQSVFAWEAVTQ
ncbi:MAG: hypothetical protein ACYSWX_05865 [Planctomycetota bacterium]|jgi:hypothetical protein